MRQRSRLRRVNTFREPEHDVRLVLVTQLLVNYSSPSSKKKSLTKGLYLLFEIYLNSLVTPFISTFSQLLLKNTFRRSFFVFVALIMHFNVLVNI